MTDLDADAIRRFLGEASTKLLAELEIFADVESTNTYLMQQPGPAPGSMRVALTDNQTAGRGRHGRTWLSPPGSGLCLSMAYTFASQPGNLPALTLALGLGVISALRKLGVPGVQLKWPNDLIALDGKLAGILTETHTASNGSVTVVTGIGLNIDLSERVVPGQEAEFARGIVDMKRLVAELPSRERIAASLVAGLSETFAEFEVAGFAPFLAQWPGKDWLYGREVTIDTPQRQITGVGAGIDEEGALLVNTSSEGTYRITSGSVVMAGVRETA